MKNVRIKLVYISKQKNAFFSYVYFINLIFLFFLALSRNPKLQIYHW